MSTTARTRWYSFLLFALLGLACLLVGGYLGARLAADAIMDRWISSQSNYTQAHILILRRLRSGDDDTAQEQLEAQLDHDIVSLLPDYYGGYHVSKQTRARAAAVLEQVRQYRADYPGPSAASAGGAREQGD